MDSLLRNIFLIQAAVILSGCGNGSGDTGRKKLASVGSNHLYEDDLKGMIPRGLSAEDSLLYVHRFIQNWAEDLLFQQEAANDKSINLSEINERVEEYRRSLVYHAHISHVVARGMDTSVSHEELMRFYRENESVFELKDDILRADYVILPAQAKKNEKARKEFFGVRSSGGALETLCREIAYRCRIADTAWMSFDEFSRLIPVDRTQSPEVFLRNRKAFEIQDTTLLYWVKIRDYKIKETLSPFELVRDEIRLIVLNRRKNEFLASYRKELFDRALQNKEVELFVP